MVRSRSKTTGEACTTATFEVIESVIPSVSKMGVLPKLRLATENVGESYHGSLFPNSLGQNPAKAGLPGFSCSCSSERPGRGFAPSISNRLD